MLPKCLESQFATLTPEAVSGSYTSQSKKNQDQSHFDPTFREKPWLASQHTPMKQLGQAYGVAARETWGESVSFTRTLTRDFCCSSGILRLEVQAPAAITGQPLRCTRHRDVSSTSWSDWGSRDCEHLWGSLVESSKRNLSFPKPVKPLPWFSTESSRVLEVCAFT